MAVLETIRVKFGILITLLIAVALLGFIIDVPSCTQYFQFSDQEDTNVGVIDGEPVTYSEFSTELERLTSVNQLMNNSSATNEQQKMLNDNAWYSIINKKLFIPNAEKAGITVTENEVLDVISGNIVSPVMTQNPLFCDQYGVFSQDYVLNFIELCEQNPSYKVLWDDLTNQVYNYLYYTKYMSILTNSDYTNPLMLKNQLVENNTTFDMEFVTLPYGYEKDSTIVVSEAEISDYYNSHLKFFKQLASRDIEYVSFVTVPSDDDIVEAKKQIDEVYKDFSTTDEMQSFLSYNSDRDYDEHWYAEGELNVVSRELNDFVFENRSGVSEIIKDGDSFLAVRIMNQARVPDSVYVKVINMMDPDSLFNEATAQWYPQMPGFEKLMTQDKGSVITLNGYKFQVVDKTRPVAKKQVAILEKEITPSEETIEKYRAMANDFRSKVNSADNFAQVARESGLYSQSVPNMLESADRLGSLSNTKEVTRWSFKAEKGQVSDVIDVDAINFVVAAVKGVHNEGYTPLEECSSRINGILYGEKLAQKRLAEVSNQINGVESLKAIATMFNTSVMTKDDVTFDFSDYSLEPKVVGAASVAEVGKIIPVAGEAAIYVFKVTDRQAADIYSEQEILDRNAQQATYSTNYVLPEMMQAADVKDYRARFF